jgi:hypothetical protein
MPSIFEQWYEQVKASKKKRKMAEFAEQYDEYGLYKPKEKRRYDRNGNPLPTKEEKDIKKRLKQLE